MPSPSPRQNEDPTRAGALTDRQLADFLSRACHDLRAPLRAIRAHAELFARDAAATPDSAQRLGFIVDGAKKVDSLVDALSAYSLALRIDRGSFQTTAMGVALRTALSKLDAALRSQSAEVTYGDLPRVTGDPDRLIELLERLIRNAVQNRGAAPPRVHITAEKQEEYWLFAVRDNGPGIDPADLERIFDPFERIQGSGAGTGLGLAICRVIAERQGGKIWAESQVGEGTTFFFTLPAD
jgi:chemotaxis family two-component system sensor kinase Cph1